MWKLRETLHGLRAWQFFSQKVLRWLTLVPLVLLLVSTATLASSPFFAALFGIQALGYAAALVGLLRALSGHTVGRVLCVPLYITVSAVGAFVGVLDALNGRHYDIWESPALSRGRDEASITAGVRRGL
jgi:cytochrome b subunit of formate dehydrogenase